MLAHIVNRQKAQPPETSSGRKIRTIRDRINRVGAMSSIFAPHPTMSSENDFLSSAFVP